MKKTKKAIEHEIRGLREERDSLLESLNNLVLFVFRENEKMTYTEIKLYKRDYLKIKRDIDAVENKIDRRTQLSLEL